MEVLKKSVSNRDVNFYGQKLLRSVWPNKFRVTAETYCFFKNFSYRKKFVLNCLNIYKNCHIFVINCQNILHKVCGNCNFWKMWKHFGRIVVIIQVKSIKVWRELDFGPIFGKFWKKIGNLVDEWNKLQEVMRKYEVNIMRRYQVKGRT